MSQRKIITIEFIFKALLAVFSFITAFIVVLEMIPMFNLFNAFKFSEETAQLAIYKTVFGDIFKSMGVFDRINGETIKLALLSFINNTNVIAIVFMCIFISMLIFVFLYPNWELFNNNLFIGGILIVAYLLKYILFGLAFLICYKDDLASLATSLILGTSFFLLMSVFELAVLSLWIIKFIFNFVGDVKALTSLENANQ